MFIFYIYRGICTYFPTWIKTFLVFPGCGKKSWFCTASEKSGLGFRTIWRVWFHIARKIKQCRDNSYLRVYILKFKMLHRLFCACFLKNMISKMKHTGCGQSVLFWKVALRGVSGQLGLWMGTFLARAPELIRGVSKVVKVCIFFNLYPLSHGGSTLAFLSSSGPQHKPCRSPDGVAEF